jgi:hypothetical protein
MLTENAIKLIEEAIGITGLQGLISSTETLDITPKKTKHFDQVSYDKMLENLTNDLPPEKYEEAKRAGEEMKVKKIKREKGFEFEGKTIEALAEYYEKEISLKSKTDVSEIEKKYIKDLEDHKKAIETERKEKENQIFLRKKDKIDANIDAQFYSLQIDVPPTLKEAADIERFRKNEIEKNKIYFKSQYQFDVDEFGTLIIKDLTGQVKKDELLNPIKIDNVVKEFAAQNFISYGVQQGAKGRGGKDQYPGVNALQGIKSVDELKTYAKEKGIKEGTEEFDAIFIEFKKNNK